MSTAKVFFLFEGLRKERPGQKKTKQNIMQHIFVGLVMGKVCVHLCVCVCGIFQFVTWKWQRILLINTVIYNDYSNYYYA